MASIYKVKSSAKTVVTRTGPGTKYSTNGAKAKGQEVHEYASSSGWVCITKNIKKGSSESRWISKTHLTKVSSTNKTSSTTKVSSNSGSVVTKDSMVITTANKAKYQKLMKEYMYALGSPPTFTAKVDPVYSDKLSTHIGRVMADTFYSYPAILSICPGKVAYLPNFSGKKKKAFWNQVKRSLSNNEFIKNTKSADKLDGKLYEFKADYNGYINKLNPAARTAALMLGIDGVTDLFPEQPKKLGLMDYAYFTNSKRPKTSGIKGVLSQAKLSVTSAVSDDQYIHFFVNHSGSEQSESITTGSSGTFLEDVFSESGELSNTANNLNFLFGGSLSKSTSAGIGKDFNKIVDSLQGQDMLSGITRMAYNYLKGGRIVFPKMISSAEYDKSVTVSMKLMCPYGNKQSYFAKILLPTLFILQMGTPQQLASNMYTYPHLIRCVQKGFINMDLAYISSINIERGGADDAAWTVDGLPTEVILSFTITPLYSNLMMTNGHSHPFLFMTNTSMLEYLGNMCGMDFKSNNLKFKLKMVKMIARSRVTDIPGSLARGIANFKLLRMVQKWTQIIN